MMYREFYCFANDVVRFFFWKKNKCYEIIKGSVNVCPN